MRKIKIWLSRGWWHIVSCVSLLVLSVLCNSCKSTSAVNRSQNEKRETVSTENDSILMKYLTPEMIERIRAYDQKSNPRRMVVYGPPYETGEEEFVPDVRPSKRALRKARKAGK